MKTLCETVHTLSTQVRDLLEGTSVRQQNQTPLSLSQGGDDDRLRVIIREESREMEERRKRKTLIVIRGVEAGGVAGVSAAFGPVARELTGGAVQLSDVLCINRDKKMYRAKISDDEVRDKLISNAKNLKNSQFSHIFINRDLTYKQRGELIRRRNERGPRQNYIPVLENQGDVAPLN